MSRRTEFCSCPSVALTVPFRIYSLGVVGSRSLIKLYASTTSSAPWKITQVNNYHSYSNKWLHLIRQDINFLLSKTLSPSFKIVVFFPATCYVLLQNIMTSVTMNIVGLN